jgi:type III restriction enzyme
VASLVLDPMNIPPEVDMKATVPSNQGRPTLSGPGRLDNVSLNPYRKDRRLQELAFDMAASLTKRYVQQPSCEAPPHVLFPQIVRIVQRYLDEKLKPASPAEKVDAFLAPYYGWIVDILSEAIRPDKSQGEAPEVPIYEMSRGPGSTRDVDFTTTRDVREVLHCHLNVVVNDTQKWEQSAAYRIDRHKAVAAFVKNAGLGFAIPYYHNGQPHDYMPDFLVRLRDRQQTMLILETKGYDPLAEVKKQAAERWVAAVNADGTYGRWVYRLARSTSAVDDILNDHAGN